eukprot:GDKI01019592.1.p1 GENE.GDKI01019592.1~~GDKI01019592.1.p1  ORF type:complete len:296 (+),score=60.47 GDKI01019592.1:1-888(+)
MSFLPHIYAKGKKSCVYCECSENGPLALEKCCRSPEDPQYHKWQVTCDHCGELKSKVDPKGCPSRGNSNVDQIDQIVDKLANKLVGTQQFDYVFAYPDLETFSYRAPARLVYNPLDRSGQCTFLDALAKFGFAADVIRECDIKVKLHGQWVDMMNTADSIPAGEIKFLPPLFTRKYEISVFTQVNARNFIFSEIKNNFTMIGGSVKRVQKGETTPLMLEVQAYNEADLDRFVEHLKAKGAVLEVLESLKDRRPRADFHKHGHGPKRSDICDTSDSGTEYSLSCHSHQHHQHSYFY